jgi:hypothetical protein
MVIELDDEVEYIINSSAVAKIKGRAKLIKLIRVVDRSSQVISARRIGWAVKKLGIIDYLVQE